MWNVKWQQNKLALMQMDVLGMEDAVRRASSASTRSMCCSSRASCSRNQGTLLVGGLSSGTCVGSSLGPVGSSLGPVVASLVPVGSSWSGSARGSRRCTVTASAKCTERTRRFRSSSVTLALSSVAGGALLSDMMSFRKEETAEGRR